MQYQIQKINGNTVLFRMITALLQISTVVPVMSFVIGLFSSLKSSQGSCIASGFHVSLISFDLEQFLDNCISEESRPVIW